MYKYVLFLFLFSAIFFALRRLQPQGTSHFSATPAPLAAVGREVVDVVAARRLAALAFHHINGPPIGTTGTPAAVLEVVLELLEDLRRLRRLPIPPRARQRRRRDLARFLTPTPDTHASKFSRPAICAIVLTWCAFPARRRQTPLARKTPQPLRYWY